MRDYNLNSLNPMKFLEMGKKRAIAIANASSEKPNVDKAINQMAKKLHPKEQYLLVKEVIEVGPNAKKYILEGETCAYFKAGQYLTITINIDGNTYSRPYSLISSPKETLDNIYSIMIKRVPDGIVSNYILDKKIDELENIEEKSKINEQDNKVNDEIKEEKKLYKEDLETKKVVNDSISNINRKELLELAVVNEFEVILKNHRYDLNNLIIDYNVLKKEVDNAIEVDELDKISEEIDELVRKLEIIKKEMALLTSSGTFNDIYKLHDPYLENIIDEYKESLLYSKEVLDTVENLENDKWDNFKKWHNENKNYDGNYRKEYLNCLKTHVDLLLNNHEKLNKTEIKNQLCVSILRRIFRLLTQFREL